MSDQAAAAAQPASAAGNQPSTAPGGQGGEGRVYTREEVEQRLRGQGAEIERLKAIEAAHGQLVREREEATRKAAEEQGRFAELYETEKLAALAAREELEQLRAKASAYEQRAAAEVQARLAAIASEAVRADVAKLLEGRSVDDQQRILTTFFAAQTSTPGAAPPRQGGAPAGAQAGAVDEKRFARDRVYRQQVALEEMARLREAGGE